METIVLKVAGMSCGHCTAAVTKELQAVPGVASVQVSLEAGAARVQYDPDKAGLDALRAAVAEAGYNVVA